MTINMKSKKNYFIQSKIIFIFSTCSILLLTACGGGNSSSNSNSSISDINPKNVILGNETTFEITGTNLGSGIIFKLENCENTKELSGSSTTKKQFSCTPTAQPGIYKGAIQTSDGSNKELKGFSIEFKPAFLHFSQVRSRVAVIKQDKSLWVWGNGIQGDGQDSSFHFPKKIGDDFTSVAVSDGLTLGIKSDGTLLGWGYSLTGVIGNYNPVLTPQVIGTQFKKVVIGGCGTIPSEVSSAECLIGRKYDFAIGLKNDGSLHVWGSRSSLDKSSRASTTTPRQIGTGFSDIAVGAGMYSFALKQDGSLWTWALNTQDPTIEPFIPKKIGDGYLEISAGYDFAVGLKTGGTLWDLLKNSPDFSHKSVTSITPVLLGSEFKSISAGFFYTMALKKDGSLWAMGDNDKGQLGTGTFNSESHLTQIQNNIVSVNSSDHCSLAQATNGSLLMWGYCMYGNGSANISRTPWIVSIPK